MVRHSTFPGSQPQVRFRHAVNLTARHVGFYDTFGDIAICDPGCHSDLLAQKLSLDTMVIVASKADAEAHGIPKENAVIVMTSSTGRFGLRVSRLARLYDNADVTFLPPSDRIRRMPDDEVYHV